MKNKKPNFFLELLKSLFSNDNAIASAKKSPIWLAIILFLVSIIMPIAPLAVNTANSYGSMFISRNSYGLEKTMPIVALQMAKDEVSFLTVNENHELGITTNDVEPAYKHVNSNTERVELEVYFSAANDSKSRSAYLNAVNDHKLVLTAATADKEATYYKPTYIVFFNNSLIANVFAKDSLETVTYSSTGDFKSFKEGTDLVKLLVKVGDKELKPTTNSEILDILSVKENEDAIFKNWKTVFDKSYLSSRTKNTWMGSLVYLGIFAVLSLIMGFIIWLLTRGKSNPFNYLSILTCYKIEAWASFCPGLIGLVVGFIMPNYAVMLFIMSLGMRIMWLSMKQLRPAPAQ